MSIMVTISLVLIVILQQNWKKGLGHCLPMMPVIIIHNKDRLSVSCGMYQTKLSLA